MSLSLIHLSDIHMENENDLILKRLKKITMACASVLPHDETVLVIVSGDIANQGKAKQYLLAQFFFDTLKKSLEKCLNSKVVFSFVPGNHDCDFALERSSRKILLEKIKTSEIDQDYFSDIVYVQKPFFDFANNYGKYDISNPINIQEIEIDDYKILVMLSNTAWMSEINENPGNIVMPELLMSNIDTCDYKYIFCVFHHPTNWLFPDKRRKFLDYIRKKSDFILIGHEHERDHYEVIGESFSILTSKGKELQDRNSESSGFSIYKFDYAWQNYTQIDFEWQKNKYTKIFEQTNQLHKNDVPHSSVFYPNKKIIDYCQDIGISISHFAKDDVTLSDLFTWPDYNLYKYGDNKCYKTIRDDFISIKDKNGLIVLIGATSEGKTSLAKKLFLCEENKNICCILLDGSVFNTSNEITIAKTIENKYIEQYSEEFLEDFRQLPPTQKTIIIDNFDCIRNNNNRRTMVLNYISKYFSKIRIFFSSKFELTTIINSDIIKSSDSFDYYDILPLGNRKRRQLISKWYRLNNFDQTENEIREKIDKSENQINTFLGNGASYIPAIPLFVISTLQNSDAKHPIYENTKYGFLYQSLILSSISKIAGSTYDNSKFDMDSTALSFLAFDMLQTQRTSFDTTQLKFAVDFMNEKYVLKESFQDLLNRMIDAKIITKDLNNDESYRFKYPYIFYYFSGYYIANHLSDKEVQDKLEYMSSRLYNEIYGNIIIFTCHFANSKEIIDNVLLNAYSILEKHKEFEFSKNNHIFDDIKDSFDAILPESISDNSEVSSNQEKNLIRKDEMGINDGQVIDKEDYINDEITEKEKDIAEVASAFKTMEVLGQILQNYPTGVEAKDKINIINEIHSLGMRAISTIVNTILEYKNDLIEYIYQKVQQKDKNTPKEDIVQFFEKLINIIIAGTASGMIHQIAKAIDNEHLLGAANASFSQNAAISSKLVLLDLKLNCFKKCNVDDIKKLRKVFTDAKETFAANILDSIVGHYLNYNECPTPQRDMLCSLCNFSKSQSLIETHKNKCAQ